jgi:hypothetical protein
MESANNLTIDMPRVWAYIQFFGCLMISLTALCLFITRFWIAIRAAAKVQRRTQWFVPQDLESDATRIVFDRSARSGESAHPLRHVPRQTNAEKSSDLRRSA